MLASEQPDNLGLYLSLGLVSCLLCLIGSLEPVSGPLIGYLCPAYHSLSKNSRLDWRSRFLSTIHAILVFAVSSYSLLAEDVIAEDRFWGRSDLVSYMCCFSCGYMIADIIMMALSYSVLGSAGYMFHHFMVIFAYMFVTNGIFQFNGTFRLLCELSTPFVNFRSMLHDLGLGSSTAYLVNGLTLLATFGVSRIFTIPYVYYTLCGLLAEALAQGDSSHLPYAYLVWFVSVSMDILNLYWFQKIVKGALKVLSKRSALSHSEGEKTKAD